MIRFATLLAAAASTLTAMPASAQERLGTLPKGQYSCGLPGDASGAAWSDDTAYRFAITSSSRYASAKGEGTYLLKGREVVFTRGPMKDMRMVRHASGILQQVEPDGNLGRLRCSRVGR